MKLSRHQLENLADRMRDIAGGIDIVAGEMANSDLDNVRYPNDSLTIRLAILLDVADGTAA